MYPVTIISDRYRGTYSKALWTAWLGVPDVVPRAVDDSDCECHEFWLYYSGLVGKGATPDEAYKDLCRKAEATIGD